MRRYVYGDDDTLLVPPDVFDALRVDPDLLDEDARDVAWIMHEKAKRQAVDVDRAKTHLAPVDDPTAVLDWPDPVADTPHAPAPDEFLTFDDIVRPSMMGASLILVSGYVVDPPMPRS